MKRIWMLALLVGCAATNTQTAEGADPVVVIKTNKGTIKVQLFEKESPETVKNFLKYVDDKHYDGTIFHRVIPNFMIQGGGFTKEFTESKTIQQATGAEKKSCAPIKNESANGLKNLKYTLAMARTNAPDSATAQFFINTKDNDFLDRAKARDKVGYAVFGKVIEGEKTVEAIRDVKTKDLIEDVFENVPVESVIIESIRRDK